MRWHECLAIGTLFACPIGFFFAAASEGADRYWICVDERGEVYRREAAGKPLIDDRGLSLQYEPAGLRCREGRRSAQHQPGSNQ